MNISINIKLYAFEDFTMGDFNSRSRVLVSDVSKVELLQPVETGCAYRVLHAVKPISMMFKTFCTSSQFLALLETVSYTVRETLERSQDWFHSTNYEDFEIVVETKLSDNV